MVITALKPSMTTAGNRSRRSTWAWMESPYLLGSGVAIFRSVYNVQGKVTRMTYHGVNESRSCTAMAIMPGKYRYDDRGNCVATTYLGLDGKPTSLAAGYASIKSTYDARGRKTRQSYHGVNGEPLLHKDGNHAWESQYDERGNEVADHLHRRGRQAGRHYQWLRDGSEKIRLGWERAGRSLLRCVWQAYARA